MLLTGFSADEESSLLSPGAGTVAVECKLRSLWLEEVEATERWRRPLLRAKS